LSKVVQRLKLARPYLGVVAFIALGVVASWIQFFVGDDPFYRGDIPFAAYLLATPVWIAFAVRERRALLWRLALIWTPLTPVVVMLCYLVSHHPSDNRELDGDALATLGYLAIGAIIGTLSTIGSVVAFVYRPLEKPDRA
jgi:hypothetical protein